VALKPAEPMPTQASKSLMTVLRGEPCDPPPMWMMRQAGRYLPEYRQLRQETVDNAALVKAAGIPIGGAQ